VSLHEWKTKGVGLYQSLAQGRDEDDGEGEKLGAAPYVFATRFSGASEASSEGEAITQESIDLQATSRTQLHEPTQGGLERYSEITFTVT
jgi:hypothetical protein